MNTPYQLQDDLHRRRLKWLIAANNVLIKALALATQSDTNRQWQTRLVLEQKMLQNLLRFVDTVELWQKANFHPDQPRVPAGNSDGGQWTDGGGGSDSGGLVQNVRQDVQSPLIPFKPLTGGGGAGGGAGLLYLPYMLRKPDEFPSPLPLEDGLVEFNRLSKQNDPNKQPIILFRPRDWRSDGSPKPSQLRVRTGVKLVTKDEIKQYCPEYDLVQVLANRAADATGPRSNYPSAAVWGTATHFNMKGEVNGYPGELYAEQSFVKYREEVLNNPERYQRDADYGEKDSIRIDTRGNIHNNTVCVYDLKTGDRGISVPRAIEIYETVRRRFKIMPEVRIVEVNPGQ